MRRMLFTLLASVAMLAFGSASALAKTHHGSHHRARHHHVLVRHEHFGTSSSGQQSAPAAPVSPPAAADTAGTVDSFAGGILTIKLTSGSLVSGMVTNDTEIECSMAQPPDTMQTNDRQDGGGDNGQGDNGQGEDHGGGGQNGDNDQQNCMSTALVPGATVSEAELRISSAGAVWDKVELTAAQTAGGDS
jgi:hypothetical protein